jgi:hypothetical protein
MALLDRNIIITPNIGSANTPNIRYIGADASNSATITVSVTNSAAVGTLTYAGANSSILTVSDGSTAGSGIVTAAGTTDTGSATLGALRVAGGVGIAKSLFVGGSGTFTSNLTVLGTLIATVNTTTNAANAYGVVVQDVSALGNQYFPTMVQNNTGSQPMYDAAFQLSFYPNSAQLLVGSVNASAFSQVTGLFAAQRNRDSAIQLANTGTSALTNAGGAVIIGAANATGGSLQFYTYTGQVGAESAGEKMRVHTNGFVGIGTSSPGSRLSVSGANDSATPLVDLVASGTGTFQRGVRLLNSGIGAGGSIMYAAGQADSSKNMGQMYFYWSGAGSNSNSLRFGLHSVDDVLNIQGNSFVGIGNTASDYKLEVTPVGGTYNTVVGQQSDLGGGIAITSNGSGSTSRVALVFRGSDKIGAAIASAREDTGATWKTYMAFYTNNLTGSNVLGIQEKMRLNSDGLLQIGTSAGTPTGTTMGTGLVVNGNQGASTSSMVLQRGGSNGLAFNIGSNTTGDTLVYDWAGGAWNINLNLAYGKLMVGSASTPQARFSVSSTTGTAGSVASWAGAHSTFGPNVNSQTGAALGLAYNTTTDQAEILSLAPSVAWKPLNIFSTDLILSSNTASEIARFNGTGLQFVSGQTLLKFSSLTGSTAADGITWYSPSPQTYGIYKTAGAWGSGPNYQQLQVKWDTGIIIDGSNGQNYGLSGLMLQPNGGNVSIGLQSKAMSRLTVYKTGTNTFSTADASSTAHLTLAGTDSLVRLHMGTMNAAPYAGWIQASYDNGGGANGVEPLLLNPGGGNVQIGVTADQGYKLYVAGTVRFNNSFYAPIMYDHDNTAYYVDPASTSNLNILQANNTIGASTNYATSQGWTVSSGDQTGYFGGNFTLNGSSAENVMAYGTDPFGRRSLLWGARNNDAPSNDDGGWNKTMSQGISFTKSYMSVVYVRRNGTTTDGTFYHGCDGGNTLNLDNSANGNPYFGPIGIGSLPQDVWCVSIGIIHAYGDGLTSSTAGAGLYRLDTGQKITTYTDYKMANNATQQVHRVYLYYSTTASASLDWWGTGFWEINGNEPSIDSLVGNVNTGWTRNAYAPYYFDTADTTYYAQPSATSTFKSLRIFQSTPTSVQAVNGAASMYLDKVGDNFIQFRNTADNGSYQGLLFSDNNQGGYVAFGNAGASPNGDVLRLGGYGAIYFDVGSQDSTSSIALKSARGYWDSSSNLFAYGSMRAPIFYDSDNTGYFADPAGRSRFSTLDFGNGSYYVGAGDWGMRNTTPYGWIQMGPANTSHAHIYTDRSNFYFNVYDLYTNGRWVMTEDYQQNGKYHGSGDGSIRAYIFYDNQDTGYYADPNSTSNMYRVNAYLGARDQNGDWAAAFRNTPTSAYAFHGDLSTGGPTGTWWFYESRRHSNGSGYWGTQVAWGWEDNANQLYQRNITNNSFSGWVKYWNTGHQLQSTIFYDANDTSRYLDPNGTSYLGTIYCGDIYNHLGGWFRNYGATGIYNQSYGNHWYADNSQYWNVGSGAGVGSGIGIRIRDGYAGSIKMYMYADNSGSGLLDSSGSWKLRMEYGNANMELYNITYLNDARAYIFYDRNDTSYYDDLNSAYGTNNNGLTSRAKMRAGLTYKYNTARNDYTGDTNYWTGTMGWGTTSFNDMFMWGNGFIDSWSNPGQQPSGTSHWETIQAMHYNNGSTGYGWQMTNGAGAPELTYIRGIWGGGFTSWYKVAIYENNSNAARAFYASVVYDADNTGYYSDPNSTSRLSTANCDYVQGNNYNSALFYGNGNTSSVAGCGMYVYSSSGNGATFAFHRGGYYAVNMGLDSDNVIRIGGWSAAGSRWQLDMSGNGYYASSSRAPIFYDNNDTSWYVDPNSQSRVLYHLAYRYDFGGVGGDSGIGNSAYNIYQVNGGWGYPFPDLGIGYHTGIRIGAYYGYNGTRFYNNHDWGTQIGSFGDGDNNLRSYYDIIAYASDRRLKENIRPIENAVAKVRTITGMVFDWKDMVRDLGFEPNAKTEVGVFAQDVEAVLPEAVTVAPFDYDWKKPGQSISGERYLTVKYEKLVPLLIQAIKEQQDQLDELHDLIKGLKDANL